MLVLYDHIIALLIVGIIVLLLFNVQQRAQQSSIERTMMYNAKQQTLDLASFLERDLSNAGYQTPPIEDAILAHNINGDGITDTLQFWGVGASGDRARIAYSVSVVDTFKTKFRQAELVLPLYELRRYERRGANFVRVGGSAPTLTGFRVDLLDNGNNPADLETVQQFKVRFSNAVLPDFNSDQYLKGYRQLHWGITVGSPSLRVFYGNE